MPRLVPALVLCLAIAAAASAQTVSERTDSDPTRPILFNVRPEFYRGADHAWRALFIARYDMATLRKRRWLGGKSGMLLRFELPAASAGTTDAGAHTGLGDAYGQVLLVPWSSGRFAFVAGSGLSIPTATHDILGSGKVTVAPVIAPVWFIRGKGMAYVKVQNFTSVAGAADRADMNFMLITPTLIHTVATRSWVLVDTETRTDWRRDGRTGVKSGLQFGSILKNGLGLWLKPEFWWGPNRDGRWNLKTGIVWYRPRTKP